MAMMKFDLAGMRVMLAMPIHRDVPWQTWMSSCQTVEACCTRGVPLQILPTVGGDTVVTARSMTADAFLRSSCTHLFFIDSDMSWKPEDFMKFLALSTKMECIVAPYTCKNDVPTFMMNLNDGRPFEDGGIEMQMNQWGCLPVRGLGLGFCIVQRHVIEKLAAAAPKLKYPAIPDRAIAKVFTTDDINGDWRGEDMNFLARVKDELGYQVWMDPTIVLGHIGSKEYQASLMDWLKPVDVQASAA